MPDDEYFQAMQFPEKGLDLRTPFAQQPPGTTDTVVNVRLFEALTQRGRGGSRSGLSKYIAGRIAGGAYPIQDLNTVVRVEDEGLGSINYQSGDSAWVELCYPGTYVLIDDSPEDDPVDSYSISEPIVIFSNGDDAPGEADGEPVGTDIEHLTDCVELPADVSVGVYFQPGAYPARRKPKRFPGHGFVKKKFPTGKFVPFKWKTPKYKAWQIKKPKTFPFGKFPKGFYPTKVQIVFEVAYVFDLVVNKRWTKNVFPSGDAVEDAVVVKAVFNGKTVFEHSFPAWNITTGGAANDPGLAFEQTLLVSDLTVVDDYDWHLVHDSTPQVVKKPKKFFHAGGTNTVVITVTAPNSPTAGDYMEFDVEIFKFTKGGQIANWNPEQQDGMVFQFPVAGPYSKTLSASFE